MTRMKAPIARSKKFSGAKASGTIGARIGKGISSNLTSAALARSNASRDRAMASRAPVPAKKAGPIATKPAKTSSSNFFVRNASRGALQAQHAARDKAQAVPKTTSQQAQAAKVKADNTAKLVAQHAARDKAQAARVAQLKKDAEKRQARTQAQNKTLSAIRSYKPSSTASSTSSTSTVTGSKPATTTKPTVTTGSKPTSPVLDFSTKSGLKHLRSPQGAKTNRRSPRTSNSLTDQELRKLASRRFR